MDQVWFVAALWLLLALVAVLAANWLRISTALSEIVVGTVAQLLIGALAGGNALGAKADWITFLAGTGAIVLTFLAGAELDPGGVSREMEGIVRRRSGRISRALPGSHARCPLCTCLGMASVVAGRRGAFDDLSGGGLRRHARTGVQSDELRQGDSRRVFH